MPTVQWAALSTPKDIQPQGKGLNEWRTKTAFEISSGPAEKYDLKNVIETWIKDDAFNHAPSVVPLRTPTTMGGFAAPTEAMPKEKGPSAAEIFPPEAADAREDLGLVESVNVPDAIDDLAMDHPAYEGLAEKERLMLQKARIGQGIFRNRLLKFWGAACSVTGCKEIELLVASHIKPWRDCNYPKNRSCPIPSA